jgi:hypothetical protein
MEWIPKEGLVTIHGCRQEGQRKCTPKGKIKKGEGSEEKDKRRG